MLLLSAEKNSHLSLAQTEGKTQEANEPAFSGLDEEELSITGTDITGQYILYAHHHFLWPKEVGFWFFPIYLIAIF